MEKESEIMWETSELSDFFKTQNVKHFGASIIKDFVEEKNGNKK